MILNKKAREFYSTGFNEVQRKYSARDLETWAIISGICKLRTYLNAVRKVMNITDNHTLSWSRNSRFTYKCAHLLLELGSSNFEITSVRMQKTVSILFTGEKDEYFWIGVDSL